MRGRSFGGTQPAAAPLLLEGLQEGGFSLKPPLGCTQPRGHLGELRTCPSLLLEVWKFTAGAKMSPGWTRAAARCADVWRHLMGGEITAAENTFPSLPARGCQPAACPGGQRVPSWGLGARSSFPEPHRSPRVPQRPGALSWLRHWASPPVLLNTGPRGSKKSKFGRFCHITVFYFIFFRGRCHVGVQSAP